MGLRWTEDCEKITTWENAKKNGGPLFPMKPFCIKHHKILCVYVCVTGFVQVCILKLCIFVQMARLLSNAGTFALHRADSDHLERAAISSQIHCGFAGTTGCFAGALWMHSISDRKMSCWIPCRHLIIFKWTRGVNPRSWAGQAMSTFRAHRNQIKWQV